MKPLFAAAALAIGLGVSGQAFAEPVKVGMITTLSGGGAGLGTDVRDGFMLSLKMSGNKDIDVIVEDDAMKPEIAVQIADKMIQSDKVDVLTGIIWSNLAMAVVPNVVAQGKFYISPNAGPSPLAGAKCDKNYFNVAYQNDNFHEAAGNYAEKQGIKKMFIMAPNYPAGTDSLNGFKRYYKGELVGEVYTKLGQTDYAAEIAQIRASGADSVFFFLPGGMGIAFMKQYAQSGVGHPGDGARLLVLARTCSARWATRHSAPRTRRRGRRISTIPRTRSSSRRSRPNTTACRRSTRRRASTRRA